MAETEVIKSTYRMLSKKYHPDLNPSSEVEDTMKSLNRAYDELIDPERRKAYIMRWMEKNNVIEYGKNRRMIRIQSIFL